MCILLAIKQTTNVEKNGDHNYVLWTRIIPCSSVGKESTFNVGDPGLIPGLGRSPGVGDGYTCQYSCLENSMDRGSRLVTVHGVAKSQTHLSNTFTFIVLIKPGFEWQKHKSHEFKQNNSYYSYIN